MAFFKSLFEKKKNEDSDGQEEFFKDDFPPVAKQPAKKKAEPNTVETKVYTAPEGAPKKSSATAKKEEKPVVKSTEKATKPGAEKKPAAKAKSAAEKKAVQPKSEAKPATKAAAKPTAAKNTTKTAKSSSKAKEITDDSPEVKGAVAISESKSTANGKWEIRRAKDGRYFFSLYASNHTVIAYSQIYSSTTAVNTGIASVITNAPKCEIEDTTLKKPVSLPCPKWEIYLDKAGEYRFRLYAPNGLVICHAAHGYASKSGCKGGIESIKRFCVEAKVDKSYKS